MASDYVSKATLLKVEVTHFRPPRLTSSFDETTCLLLDTTYVNPSAVVQLKAQSRDSVTAFSSEEKDVLSRGTSAQCSCTEQVPVPLTAQGQPGSGKPERM